MPNCALVSLRLFESVGLIMSVIAGYMSIKVLNFDRQWQDTIQSSVHGKEDVNIVDFISKNVNWEYWSCVMQVAIVVICIGHVVFCQIKISPIKQFSVFKSVAKCSAYISAAAGICLVLSATYSDDKKYKHFIEGALNAKVLSSGMKPDTGSTFDFFCSSFANVWSNLTTGNNATHESVFASRLICEYTYTKYFALAVLLFNCILFGTMYNYAHTKQAEFQRADLSRFIMERVPLPASCRNINRVIPMPGLTTISQVIADDLPPSYDEVVVDENKTSNEVVDASPELIDGLDENNNISDPDQSESLTDGIVDVIPPSYELASLSENKI